MMSATAFVAICDASLASCITVLLIAAARYDWCNHWGNDDGYWDWDDDDDNEPEEMPTITPPRTQVRQLQAA